MLRHSLLHAAVSSHSRSLRLGWRVIIAVAAIGLWLASISGTALADISIAGDVSVNLVNPNNQALIGIQGLGSIQIDDGSVLATGQIILGQAQTGVGLATVSGAGSRWSFTNSADVGAAGVGRLDVLNGAVVSQSQSSGFRIGATQSGGHGTVRVEGLGSLLLVADLLSVGGNLGQGLLQIADDALVNVPSDVTLVGVQGRIELAGGMLRTSQLNNDGVVAGSGEIVLLQSATMTHDGRIEAGAGDVLRVTGPSTTLQNYGIIEADGGEIEIGHRFFNGGEGQTMMGEITLRNGVARFTSFLTSQPQLTNSGILAATGGVNDLYGRVSNSGAGKIAVTNQSVLIFHDDVTAQDGEITVFPGSSAVFLEDLTIGQNAMLLADLAGTNEDTGFGQIEVVGNAQLGGGELQVSLADGFTPALGDSFSLLASAAGIQGTLSLAQMPPLPAGMMWDLDIEAHRVLLNVVAPLEGDYNGDGSVNVADYTLWRDSVGTIDLAADGDHSGTIDAGDYDVWKSNYGNSIDGGGSISTAVPEPARAIGLLFCAVAMAARRRR